MPTITRAQLVEFLDQLGVPGVRDARQMSLSPGASVEFVTTRPVETERVVDAIAVLGLDATDLAGLTCDHDGIDVVVFDRDEHGGRVLLSDGRGYAKHHLTLNVEDEEAEAS